MSFLSKLFGKKKKDEPVKEPVVETAVVEEPVVEEPVAEEAPVEEPVVEEAPAEEVDLASLKVVELKELAKAKGVPGYSKLKKAELVEALKE